MTFDQIISGEVVRMRSYLDKTNHVFDTIQNVKFPPRIPFAAQPHIYFAAAS